MFLIFPQQFYRVLKTGGLAMVAAWDRDPNSIAMKMFKAIITLDGLDEFPFDVQRFGGDGGIKAMEDAGFVDVKGEQILIPLYVPDGQGLRDLFPFMVKSTPLDLDLAEKEAAGRENVRDEACAIFERQVLQDIKEGRAPTGPGLPAPGVSSGGAPAFFMKAILIQGRKKD
ncbi:unnamed protein product [Sphacelaria rigidula]